MELTKEHFDQALKGLATKTDLEATENDLAETITATERRLMKHSGELQEELARMVSNGFADVQKRLDVKERIERHEKAILTMSKKLGLHFEF